MIVLLNFVVRKQPTRSNGCARSATRRGDQVTFQYVAIFRIRKGWDCFKEVTDER